MNTFSIDESLSEGWRILKEKFWFLMGWMVIVFVVSAAPAFLKSQLHLSGFSSLIVHLLFVVLELIIALGSIRIFLDLIDGKPVSYNQLWQEKNLFLTYLVATLLVAILAIAGLILFIVPVFFVAIHTMFYRFFIVDKKAGVIESIKLSSQTTKGNRWQLLGLLFVLVIVNLIGFCALGIGLFVTAPLSALTVTSVYRKLSGGQNLPMKVVPSVPTTVAAA